MGEGCEIAPVIRWGCGRLVGLAGGSVQAFKSVWFHFVRIIQLNLVSYGDEPCKRPNQNNKAKGKLFDDIFICFGLKWRQFGLKRGKYGRKLKNICSDSQREESHNSLCFFSTMIEIIIKPKRRLQLVPAIPSHLIRQFSSKTATFPIHSIGETI